MDKGQLWDKLDEAYNYEVPEYILNIGKNYIILNVQDILTNKVKRLKVTIKDVALYYSTQANNLSSGIRVLAGHKGDWRNIDFLANECLNYFKMVNLNGMRKTSIDFGLNPRF